MITQNSTRVQALDALFKAQLQDLYWAEKHLLDGLEVMASKSTSPELTTALTQHREETDKQIQRLEQIFRSVEERASGRRCEAMVGLLKEAEELIRDTEEGTLIRDAAIILGAQKIEHYEIASYGTLVALADLLRYEEAGRLLDETLEEEKNADLLLTEIAEGFVNEAAREESE